MRANASIRYSPTSAACQLVPQAVSTIRSIGRSCCGVRFRPPNTAVAWSRSSRPRIAFEHRLRLLEDLLEHVVRIVAQLDLVALGLEQLHVVVDVPVVAVHDANRPVGDHGDLVVGEVDDLVGVADQRRGVAGDEVLALADADHQRALQPGRDDHVRPIAEHDAQAVGAVQLRERRLHRLDQRRVGIDRSRPVRRSRFSSSSAIRWAITSVSVAVLNS